MNNALQSVYHIVFIVIGLSLIESKQSNFMAQMLWGFVGIGCFLFNLIGLLQLWGLVQ